MDATHGSERPAQGEHVPLRDVIEAFLEEAPEGVVISDRDDRIALVNARAEELLGYERAELVGQPLWTVFPEGLPRPDGQAATWWETELDTAGRQKDGSHVPLHVSVSYPEAGGVLSATAFIRRAEVRAPDAPGETETSASGDGAQASANGGSPLQDALTGLPGRVIFLDRLSVALARSSRRSSQVAVLILDLDGFRLVNDSYGKETGDRVLQSVAERIFGALRPGDTVARIGEDEFAILCDDIAKREGAATIAERVHTSVNAPFAFDGEDVSLSSSLGFAIGSGRDQSPESLFRQANDALQQAKARGAGHLEGADGGPSGDGAAAAPESTAAASKEGDQATGQTEAAAPETVPAEAAAAGSSGAETAETAETVGEARPLRVETLEPDQEPADDETLLRRAVEQGQFRLLYQPIVRLGDGRIAGVEALLRWEHPQRGLLSPGAFMAQADETGLIHTIGSWVLRQTVADSEALQAVDPNGRPLMLSVNLSARQLAEPGFADVVRGVLAGSRVDPGTVFLEVGESSVMEDTDAAAAVLRDLRSTGVRMSIDDFGTGFSSLLHLNRFPIDFLKVDRSFVDGLERDTGASNIVTAVISMAHALGLPAIAEGVETEGQLYTLRRLGCDYAQGYLFARPQPLEAVIGLLEQDPVW